MDLKDFKFKKNYGQNFLREKSIVEKIADSAEIAENSLVIEIGPGSGMLTIPLVKRAKQVLCYEIDVTLKDILNDNLSNYDNVDVIYDDFLNRNVRDDIEKYSYDNLYVVSNLPYYITTPIITKIIDDKLDVSKIVVMVQKEVGDRFAAKVGSKEYNSLTVFLNYYFNIKKLFVVSRNCFVPKPNVDSIVVQLSRKEEVISVNNLDVFFKLVRDSFTYKRKTLRNNLKNYNLDKINVVLRKYNLDLNVRAEDLSLDMFVDISNNL